MSTALAASIISSTWSLLSEAVLLRCVNLEVYAQPTKAVAVNAMRTNGDEFHVLWFVVCCEVRCAANVQDEPRLCRLVRSICEHQEPAGRCLK